MHDPEPVEELLRRTIGREVTRAQLAALDERLADRVREPSRRRARVVLLAVAVAALLVMPTLAIATGLVQRLTESPEGLVTAAQYQEEVSVAKATVPKPDGWSWPASLDLVDPGGAYAAGAGRPAVESVAFCLWAEDWISARDRGDEAEATVAAQTLLSVRGWSIYAGVQATDQQRTAMDRLIDAVAAGTETPVRDYVTVNCSSGS
jgi:hypothetical protein